MENVTRSTGVEYAPPLPEGFEASIRATWEAGYRAALRDEFGGEDGSDAESARDAWNAHGELGMRYA